MNAGGMVARRFRDFVNFSAYLDVRPNDDIVDILGFLSFEMVRSLCVAALEVRHRLERTAPPPPPPPPPPTTTRKPPTTHLNSNFGRGARSPSDRRSVQISESPGIAKSLSPDDIALSPTTTTTMEARKHGSGLGVGARPGILHPTVSLFAPPPSARQALLPSHVLEAFAQIQRYTHSTRAGGMRNFRGGINRSRVALV